MLAQKGQFWAFSKQNDTNQQKGDKKKGQGQSVVQDPRFAEGRHQDHLYEDK